jgi:methylmalonyl-CoA mutase cobalamin-binding domain/chain
MCTLQYSALTQAILLRLCATTYACVQQDAGAGDVTVICGGVIPPDDYAMLYNAGVKAIFGPGTKVTLLFNYFKKNTVLCVCVRVRGVCLPLISRSALLLL